MSDASSVHSWVMDCEAKVAAADKKGKPENSGDGKAENSGEGDGKVDNPVLYYKQQDEDKDGLPRKDFVLVIMTSVQKYMLNKLGSDRVCVDSTHGTNIYGFLLTTLHVVDEFEVGFPVAFLISSSTTTQVLSVFYRSIRDALGVSCLTSDVFMSDDDPAMYNAWRDVFGAPDRRILCTWHVNRAWRGKLKTIQCKERREAVHKALMACRDELDIAKFNTSVDALVADLLSDPDTRRFETYFSRYYRNRPEQWAFCHRIFARVNNNMRAENFHRRIKHAYLMGKSGKRVDNCIEVLLLLVRDKACELIGANIRQKRSKRMREIALDHNRAKLVVKDRVDVSSDTWEFPSETTEGRVHLVKCDAGHVCDSRCKMRCKDCSACVKRFLCTCARFSIHGYLCKHVHAAAMQVPPGIRGEVQPSSARLEEKKELEFLSACVSVGARKVATNQVQGIADLLVELQGLVTQQQEGTELLNAITEHLRSAKKLMITNSTQAAVSQFPAAARVPHNKRSVPQKRYRKLKQPRAKKPKLQRAAPEENSIIMRHLLGNEEVVSTCTDNVHVGNGEVHVSPTSSNYSIVPNVLQQPDGIVLNDRFTQDLVQIIVDERGQLTDRHMYRAQYMLKRQFPDVKGLEDVLLAVAPPYFTCQANNNDLVVQVHHTGASNHWVVSCRQPGSNTVYIYDSLLDNNCMPRFHSDELQKQLTCVYGNINNVVYPLITRQINNVDCGLFAIAVAADLCFRKDPCLQRYPHGIDMRNHLAACFLAGYISRL